MASLLPRRQYTSAEWEAKKDVILKLKAQGRELNQILKELEKRYPDFRPTLPMLKKRMKEWKITSYHKEPDIAEAVRITADREKINKKTHFRIGDKEVTQEEIHRYLRRKGVRNPRAWAANIAKQPASTIQPFTPAPSPPATIIEPNEPSEGTGSTAESTDGLDGSDSSEQIEEIAHVPESVRFQIAQATFNNAYAGGHIQNLVNGPQEMQMLSKALYHTNNFCDRLMWTEAHSPGLSDLTSDALNDFTNGMWKGWDFLFDDNPLAFEHFNHGMASLNRLVREHNRRFLPELLEMLLNLQLEPQIDILEKLLHQLAGLYDVYGMTHEMIYQIVVSLLQLDKKNRLEVVEKLMRNVSDHWSNEFGKEDPETKSIDKALTRSAYRKLPVSQAISQLEGFLRKDEETHEMTLYDKCNVCIELALCYRSQRNILQVEAWITQAMFLASGLDSNFHKTDIRVRCHRVMSYVERRKDNWQGAYEHWKSAVAESAVGLGNTDSLTVLVESELADFMQRASLNDIQLVDEPVAGYVEPVGFVEAEGEVNYLADLEGSPELSLGTLSESSFGLQNDSTVVF
ncbi:hypothetical protein ABW19_dt0209129 [Dactylella cylindrospora]|nr:hypothetical protein ABW19_dt0209129 [Dactylella cylindrospora]